MDADTITLPVRPEWRAAARYIGHKHVRTWIECVVEDFLETGAGRYFPLLPLDWQEQDFSAIRTDDGHAYNPHPVRGPVSGPFGIYRGCYAVPHDPARERSVFTLCHVPTGRNLCTLPRVRDCKALAEELAALPLRWHDADPEKVIGSVEAGGPFRAIVSRYRHRTGA